MSLARRLRHIIRHRLWTAGHERVWAGPYAGLEVRAETVLCALLGTYEIETHPWIERIVAGDPDVLCYVGAADGYEVAGLLRRLPGTRAVAWEADDVRRAAMSDMLARNGVVDRVRVAGFCQPRQLEEALHRAERAVVLLDVDGGEAPLSDPKLAPALARATLLVETHDIFVPGIHEIVCRQLEPTHTLEVVTARARSVHDLPDGAFAVLRYLLPRLIGRALDERRPGPQQWVLATPRHR